MQCLQYVQVVLGTLHLSYHVPIFGLIIGLKIKTKCFYNAIGIISYLNCHSVLLNNYIHSYTSVCPWKMSFDIFVQVFLHSYITDSFDILVHYYILYNTQYLRTFSSRPEYCIFKLSFINMCHQFTKRAAIANCPENILKGVYQKNGPPKIVRNCQPQQL